MVKILKSLLTTQNSSQQVKVSIATNLKNLAKYLTPSQLDFFMTSLISEKNDQIRIQLMSTLTALKPSNSQFNDLICNSLSKLKNDESWRVRLTIAEKLTEIIQAHPNEPKIKNIAVDAFAGFLEDNEGEVRNMTCKKMDQICKLLVKDTSSLDKILSKLKKLERDPVLYVRESLANNFLRLSPIVGEEKTNEFILPVFLEFIKDESHDIRMTLIKSLDKLHEIVKIDNHIAGIMPALSEISNSKNWRIRKQILDTLPTLAKILNKKLFMEHFFKMCLNMMTDPVYAIRETSCGLIKRLYLMIESDDFEKRLMEKLNEMKNNESYLIRNTVTMLIREFIKDEKCFEFVNKKLIGLIIKLSKDKISNIRTNCAAILRMYTKIKKDNKEVNSCLDDLRKDKDNEVVYAMTDN